MGSQALLCSQIAIKVSARTSVIAGWTGRPCFQAHSRSCWPENHSSSAAAVWPPCFLLRGPLPGAVNSVAASFSLGPGRKTNKGRQDGSHDQLAILPPRWDLITVMCLCVHMCACIGVYVCGGQGLTTSVFLHHLSTLHF